MSGRSGSVALSGKNHIPYSRLDELEDTAVDNVVLTVRLGGIKLVVTTSNVRPNDIEGSRRALLCSQKWPGWSSFLW